ncbi:MULTISPECIES: isoprenylcysteine carboxyl methyltransferase family protein [Virgibacillus]|uniref:Isoprenylcysteine carboxyl methyltransferase n=2 Tax=Virgibacillus TaxID=84406 RepID=A0A024QCC0_9BACI|nr:MULTISPECIES: isoprenylcysteine carboxylmethyltransferase family protein [Virgibacillus]EQB36154.1 hypothetical protein M948_14045 [Virgibacillus sp. CM-4]GGJ46231.1 hypothetical protein GCM10007111_05270 [Virgibacillus kapii]CDQ39850.1 Putative protein-S-isoprenylcysteine methyltransferase [Virgibacillus massiliensis]
MPIYMWLILSCIVLQRIIELRIARSNEKWMKEHGGVEKGRDHYKWFLIVHTLFFVFLIAEALWRNNQPFQFSYSLFVLFIITQCIRIWCITTLGKFWNTKIIISPQFSIVNEGPYKFVKHPNYIIVGVELFVIPLLFHAYFTAMLFPLLHIFLLFVRIPIEEKALKETKI